MLKTNRAYANNFDLPLIWPPSACQFNLVDTKNVVYFPHFAQEQLYFLDTHYIYNPFLQSLVIPEKFQHILRVLNTNIDGRRKIMFALTAIKVGQKSSYPRT